MSKRSLLMASGGIDSTVLMYLLRDKIQLALVADFGQASFKQQFKVACWHAMQNKLPIVRLAVPYPKFAGRKEYMRAGFAPPQHPAYFGLHLKGVQLNNYMRNEYIWLEGRNSLIYTHAGIYAATYGFTTMYNGLQYDEPDWLAYRNKPRQHGDATPHFVRVMNTLYKVTLDREVQIRSPFYEKRYTKQQVLDVGRDLQVPIPWTFSCEFYPPCGTCHACVRIKHFGVKQLGRPPHKGELEKWMVAK